MKDLPFSVYELLAVLLPGFMFSMTVMYLVGPMPEVKDSEPLLSLYLVCLSYLAGQFLAQGSLTLIEAPTKKLLGQPVLILLNKTKGFCFFRWIFPFYFRPMHSTAQNQYSALINSQDNQDILHLTYEAVYARARASSVADKLSQWSRAAAFSRNVVFGALVIALGGIIASFFEPRDFSVIIVVCILLAALMYYRYLRFFKIFSLELVKWFCEQKHPL